MQLVNCPASVDRPLLHRKVKRPGWFLANDISACCEEKPEKKTKLVSRADAAAWLYVFAALILA